MGGALGIGPELSLGRGGRGAAEFQFAAGALPSGAVLTRASAGRRCDASGASVVEASNAARFDYDPTTHGYRGLLIEPAATNLLPRSSELDNAVWSAVRASVSGNLAAAPDGTTAAEKIVPSTASNSHYVVQTRSFSSGTTYSYSHYLKAAGYRFGRLSLPGDAFPVNNRAGTFDLQTGTVTNLQSGITAAIEDAGDGWFRCTIARAATATASDIVGVAVNQTGSSTLEVWAANGSDGILAWGGQVEVGGATSHVATSAATTTREADVLTLDWASRGVANGAVTLRFTFDDGSTQDVATSIAGGTAVVPTNLNRRWLRRVEKI